VPVFLADINIDPNGGQKFEPVDYRTNFPDAPHLRSRSGQSFVDKMSKDLPEDQKAFLGSIKQTMAEIFLLQGYSLKQRAERKEDLTTLTHTLMQTLEKHPSQLHPPNQVAISIQATTPIQATAPNQSTTPSQATPVNTLAMAALAVAVVAAAVVLARRGRQV